MKKHLFFKGIFVTYIFFVSGCATTQKIQKSNCSILGSAVSAASYAVIGEYGDTIPSDLPNKFLSLVEKKIPDDYFRELKRYQLDIKPKGSYYLLIVVHPGTKSIILFDYSCTSEPDGMVCLEPDKYDLNDLGLYNSCE